ncbi:MAG: DUF1351 domain-containing protein [Treponema sp.]|nr:DUF1351 domain-containing protein [Treponema sp.]
MKNDETNTAVVIPLISEMEISTISDNDLETAFLKVAIEHKDAVVSIHQSMVDATDAYAKYLNEGYEPMEEVAKCDRATLNKAEKNIAEKYASLKAAYEKPLENIELNIKSIRNAIKKASGIVDGAVKTYEEKEKGKKREEIQVYFNTKQFDLVPLDKIFNSKWLNKTCKIADIKKEIDIRITTILGDIKTLENIAEYGLAAKTFYLDTLDMSVAMRQVENMKANAERLAREKVEREERERQKQVAQNAVNEHKEEQTAAKEEQVKNLVDEALDIPEPAVQSQPEIVEYTLRFKGTKEQLLKLREYMTANGIVYEKL